MQKVSLRLSVNLRVLALKDRVQRCEQLFNVKTVSGRTLLEGFVYGAHAANAAKVEGTENLDNFRAFLHNFVEGHIFCDYRHLCDSI